MGTAVLTNGTVLVDDAVREAANTSIERAHDRRVVGVKLTLQDGSELDLGSELSSLVFHMLKGTAQGAMTIRNFPEELTSTSAADLLAVSRPTLMKWLNEGQLTSRQVGSHHRFATADVIALARKRQAELQDAFDRLRALEDQIDKS